MCGRYEIHSAIEIIAMVFDINLYNITYTQKTNYNVAPMNEVPIVIQNGDRRIVPCRWGFLPSWAKEEKIGYRLINARAETVDEKPTFIKAFERHRCLVVADGFYEWQKKTSRRNPVYVHLKSGEPLGFAGLYNIWTSPGGKEIRTCTIITTQANDMLQPIHNRMPVITPRAKYDLWLDPETEDRAALKDVLKPYSSKELELYDVTPLVNSPRNNSPENIQRIR